MSVNIIFEVLPRVMHEYFQASNMPTFAYLAFLKRVCREHHFHKWSNGCFVCIVSRANIVKHSKVIISDQWQLLWLTERIIQHVNQCLKWLPVIRFSNRPWTGQLDYATAAVIYRSVSVKSCSLVHFETFLLGFKYSACSWKRTCRCLWKRCRSI